jgi:endoglucanase
MVEPPLSGRLRFVTGISVRHFAPIKRLLRWALLIASLAATVPATAGTVVADHGRLRVVGNAVVDRSGRPFAVHGMSLFWSQWQPRFYDRKTIDWLVKDWRVTVVRASIAAASDGYDTDPAGQTRRAEAVIDAAIAAGIYVIVDWHAHDPKPAEAVRFFTHIARKYCGVPNLIYEPWNEPLPKYAWAGVIKPYHQRVIGAIQTIDRNAFVVAGTRSWSQDVDEAAADPLPFDNVAYTLHFYSATHRQALRDKGDLALKRGAALFVTEFGVTAADGDAPIDWAEAERWFAWCVKHSISYANWSIADKDEASAALRPGAPLSGWSPRNLTRSGTLMRTHLRELASR